MKIGFNVFVGFGNNGGSRDIIKCNEIFNNMSHDSVMVARNKGSFTWFDFEEPLHSIPSGLDVLIATGAKTVRQTILSDAKIKAWYIRGHEIWQLSEKRLAAQYLNKDIINIVNSKGLKRKLKSLGVKEKDIYIVPQGLDLELWRDYGIRKKRDGRKINIGSFFTNRDIKNWKEFKKIVDILGHDDYNYFAFGSQKCNEDFLKRFHQNPTLKQLNDMYNECDIWISPTTLEGLHNIPMEAALCGCLIICGNYDMNGMIYDYAFDNVSAMVYKSIEHACELVRNPNYNLIPEMKKIIKQDIGSREKNMKKMLTIFEQKLKEKNYA
jgi:glycosyltransferase involved in cell wall biosynthesis